MAASDDRAKVAKLFDALRELDDEYTDKRATIYGEIAAVIGGGEGIGPKLQRLKRTFSELWQKAYQSGPYQFDHRIDTGHLKRFLKTHSEDEIAGRMVAYLRTPDQFYIKCRHSFGLFVKGFNSFVAPVTPQDDRAASDTSEKLRGLRGE